MIITLYVIGLFLFINGVYQLVKYLIISSRLKKRRSISPHSNDKKKIFILIPVLHEEKTIEKFLSNLSTQDYPKEFFEVYIITTEKEYLNKVKPNTIDIINHLKLEQKISKLQLNIIHYPKIDGFKSHQLSYAFQQIRSIYCDSIIADSYFLFLDADSIVDTRIISRFNNTIDNSIEIYQQPLLWFKNIKDLKSPIMQSFAFQQSFFSISYEIPMFTEIFFPWRLKYFVGHGLCVKGSFLLRLGGVPDIIEDVRLGRISSFLNTNVKLVPDFGIVESAKNFFVYIKQSSVWFFGCGLFISDYVHTLSLRKNKVISIRDIILISYGFFKAFRWLNKGLLHLIGLILAPVYSFSLLFALFLLSLLINSSVPVLLVAKDFRQVWQNQLTTRESLSKLFNAIIFSPILYMFNFIGLYYGLFKLITFYLWGKIILPKTDR